MSGPLLSVKGVAKTYSRRCVLSHATLELRAGETYVLTGDNGAGKSTLLRIMCGIERADAGTIEFDSARYPLSAYPDFLRRSIVYVHQHPYLFHSSIAENIAYGLRARGVERAARATAVAHAMTWAGVAHLAHVPAAQLSGGEKQRVALARARVLRPKVYLLDEPTTNLDRAARAQAFDLIAGLRGDGVAVLIATHDREVIALPHVKRLQLEDGAVSEPPTVDCVP